MRSACTTGSTTRPEQTGPDCYCHRMRVAGGVGAVRPGLTFAVSAVLLLNACAQQESKLIVRSADEVQVLTPAEVIAMRDTIETTIATVPGDTTPTDDGAATGETVPQNADDRPAELRLFDAFGKFRGCIEDKGFTIDGDLRDPNNPAYQQPGYAEAIQTCAARSDIANVLAEVEATRSSLTPEEVQTRNETFVNLRDCLVDRGWTIETRTSDIGLLEPAVFQNADGVLDERDINQCLSDLNIET